MATGSDASADPGTVLTLGDLAPDFALEEVTEARTVRRDDLTGDALVVMFLCTHCPFVIHVQHRLSELARDYRAKGASFVGIGANDPGVQPDDAPEGLAEQKRRVGFDFPYLFDATQAVAKAYGAVCTPDFFVFDRDRRLAYRGRMDATRPDRGEPTGDELAAALDAVLAGKPVTGEQFPPMGCSIKWAPGNDPAR